MNKSPQVLREDVQYYLLLTNIDICSVFHFLYVESCFSWLNSLEVGVRKLKNVINRFWNWMKLTLRL